MKLRLAIFIVILLSACNSRQVPYQQRFYIFGTLVDISIWGVSEKQAVLAINAVVRDFQRMHHAWHAWHPGPLDDLNQAIAAGKTLSAEASLLPLIRRSQTLYRQSDGLFNPAIGALNALWGFHNDELPTDRPPPPDSAIAELLARRPGMDDLEIHGNSVHSNNTSVRLDFGAIAKGYAVDLAIRRLRELGVENAIINAGGNLRAIGRRGERRWRIGVRDPNAVGILASLEIDKDESVFTSGNYERFYEHQGVRYSHIIDPRTGRPVSGPASVTVIHDNGATADAASTALTVAGLSQWQRIAKQMGIRYVMLVDEAGTVYMNPAMAKRLHFETEKLPKIEIMVNG
ncbi:MAG: FAD:protein FMN transferase [Gammaproteobacteria bacterium]|nr:FAD:protein FMN transferase [Gammaproteobacteria bacterium]